MTRQPAYTSGDVHRARRQAREVMEHFFGSRPRRLVHKASGLSNTVFEVEHDQGRFIVRIAPDATRLPSFLKEQWCVERAREAGVPVAEILEVGQGVIASPYMIQRLERGSEATDHPQRLTALRGLGGIARMIHSIRTEGFGETFDWSSNTLSFNRTFRNFLESEFDWRGRMATLERQGMLAARQAKAAKRAVGRLAKGPHEARLAHGDLRLKNVLVDSAGAIKAILDWEHCCSSIAPAWDLAIALHDLSIDGKQAFVDGYGLTAEDIAALAPAMKVLNILHYAPHVARAAEAKDDASLNAYRMRLSGAFELFDLG